VPFAASIVDSVLGRDRADLVAVAVESLSVGDAEHRVADSDHADHAEQPAADHGVAVAVAVRRADRHQHEQRPGGWREQRRWGRHRRRAGE
jgi:hypothetical protein